MKKISVLLLAAFFFVQCKDDDEVEGITIRDRQEVYTQNNDQIETYLKTHKVVFDAEQSLTFEEVAEGDSSSIWNQQDYPLQSKIFSNDTRNNNTMEGKKKDDVAYNMYYLIINEGGGNKSQTFDNVFFNYKGYNLDNKVFDTNDIGAWTSFPKFGDEAVYPILISGVRQALTLVNTASTVELNLDGTVAATDPGRVIVFVPSGLGYFNLAKGDLLGYQPSIFDLTVVSKKEVDHDGDGVLTKYEDTNADGNIWNDDTDGDKKINFLDIDDDADGVLTKTEISYEAQDTDGNTITKTYSFEEIPNCEGGDVKKHLDASCQ